MEWAWMLLSINYIKSVITVMCQSTAAWLDCTIQCSDMYSYIVDQTFPFLWRNSGDHNVCKAPSTLPVLYTQYPSHDTWQDLPHFFVLCYANWKWSNTGGTSYDCWVNSHAVHTCTTRACKDKEWEISAHENRQKRPMWKIWVPFPGLCRKISQTCPPLILLVITTSPPWGVLRLFLPVKTQA